jgi:hypothetical protein
MCNIELQSVGTRCIKESNKFESSNQNPSRVTLYHVTISYNSLLILYIDNKTVQESKNLERSHISF